MGDSQLPQILRPKPPIPKTSNLKIIHNATDDIIHVQMIPLPISLQNRWISFFWRPVSFCHRLSPESDDPWVWHPTMKKTIYKNSV